MIRGDEVLLIRRGREPMIGRWSVPGGALEVGETVAGGVAREVWEETGVRVRPVEMVATLDRISRDDEGRVRFHYVLLDWLCVLAEPGSGADLRCGDDASEAAWARIDALDEFGLEPVTLEVIDRAARRRAELSL